MEKGASRCAGCLLVCPRFVVSRFTPFLLGGGSRVEILDCGDLFIVCCVFLICPCPSDVFLISLSHLDYGLE